jgi:hypothetical protein
VGGVFKVITAMRAIYLGPDNKQVGLSWNHIYIGNLPIDKGDFPLNVKEAVAANPLLENSFMDYDRYVALRPHKAIAPTAPPPIVRQGTPILKRAGLQKR